MKLKAILLFFFLVPIISMGQQAISVKPIMLGYHPYADPNNSIAPSKIGDDGTFASEPGLILGYENYFLNPNIGVKGHAGFFKDNGAKSSLLMHLGLRFRSVSKQQSIHVSIGPSFFMRQPWIDVPDHHPQDFWSSGSSWESRIMWLSGEIEMIYALTPQHRLNVAFNHTAPQTFTFTIGYSFWHENLKRRRRGRGSKALFKTGRKRKKRR